VSHYALELHQKRRFAHGGIAALFDRVRTGRLKVLNNIKIVLAAFEPPQEYLGVTHWSNRPLVAQFGISNVRMWR